MLTWQILACTGQVGIVVIKVSKEIQQIRFDGFLDNLIEQKWETFGPGAPSA